MDHNNNTWDEYLSDGTLSRHNDEAPNTTSTELHLDTPSGHRQLNQLLQDTIEDPSKGTDALEELLNTPSPAPHPVLSSYQQPPDLRQYSSAGLQSAMDYAQSEASNASVHGAFVDTVRKAAAEAEKQLLADQPPGLRYVDRALLHRAESYGWPLAEMLAAVDRQYKAMPQLRSAARKATKIEDDRGRYWLRAVDLKTVGVGDPPGHSARFLSHHTAAQSIWKSIWAEMNSEGQLLSSEPKLQLPLRLGLYLIKAVLLVIILAGIAYLTSSGILYLMEAAQNQVRHPGVPEELDIAYKTWEYIKEPFEVFRNGASGALQRIGIPETFVPWTGAAIVFPSMINTMERVVLEHGPRITANDWTALVAAVGRYRALNPHSVESDEDTSVESPAAGAQQHLLTQDETSERAAKIAEVHAAIKELDDEWVQYRLSTYDWHLGKPALRNPHDPVTKAFRDAHGELLTLADDLSPSATDKHIDATHDAARRALKAWGEANNHAIKIGVSNLSASEEAALTRLHGLVNQLNDRSTPKEMWPQLISAITRTMDKLVTVPYNLSDIAELPVIHAESRLRALEQAPAASEEPSGEDQR
ncbi:hypothetical protein [Mycobacteroides abscessus]|uniref:Uncharacterized protein n=1 Tax=Mycobacteroides abscessus TaxID=36809 RepID=A0A0U0ZT69_9MYCO|nr:hypothetical protein [Mycobacteroides abscessus]CPV66869.1 Uncharacterised protein [Mycobacteroides abscessus]